ncbi:MAG: heme A synthase [Chitinophagaceae bacterium]|nr:MAG: heme A synthase [Chitinophagaceae bacterium]
MQISHQKASTKAVATWIYIGVVMLLIQVILGGITRLTGSGLSITEWNVVTGTLPPLNAADWLKEFEKYQATPQYRLLNMDFTLDDFKYIFFWEWFHRFWARLIGVVFVVGFIYLVNKRYLRREMYRPLIVLFLLGALQGAVGWIMVASGLTGDALYVKPTRLALHFVFAMVLIAYAFWFALQLSVSDHERLNRPDLKRNVLLTLVILFFQLIYGALMAGHKAATAAPTWPDINGSFAPESLFRETPFLLNFIDNTITVHFVHRNLAYLLLLAIIILTIQLLRVQSKTRLFSRAAILPIILALLQVLLGIISVLVSPRIIPGRWGMFEWMAQLHQITGMLLVLSIVSLWYLTAGKSFNSKR